MDIPLLRRRDVHGYEALQAIMKDVDHQKEQTVIYFCGNRNSIDGISWCPDCVESDVHVNSILKEIYEHKVEIPHEREFITCFVGDREEWVYNIHDLNKEQFSDGNVKIISFV